MSNSQDLLRKLMLVLMMLVVPLASLLAFSVQPLMGKHLLPMYGGAVGTWLGTMLYFQIALLAGYAWAAWLIHRPKQLQVYATVTLGVLGIVMFGLPSTDNALPGSIWQILWSLSITTLPAMILLFSVSTLMHGWIQHHQQAVPYYLYAFSNVGSLAALLLYPFLIEPWIGTSQQAFFWLVLFVVVTCLLAIAGFIFLRTDESADTSSSEAVTNEPLSWQRVIFWLGLSALTCAGMLGATHHVAVEIGSNPLSWIGPFGIYLLSFTLIFSGHWRSWMTRICIVWLGISLTGYMLSKGFTAATVNGLRFWWLLSLTAAGSFLGNALLYSLRPAQRFERYYLLLAAGGVIGGLLSSVIIPNTLARPLEFVLASIVLLITGMLWLMPRRDAASVVTVIVVLAAPILGIGFNQDANTTADGVTIKHFRDLYGHSMLTLTDTSVVLSSETTTHGSQLITDEASRHRPTLYYTESTAVGRTIEKFNAERSAINVGIIGLGAGTLAAYGRAGDRYDFWDIDPKSIRIARENFTFIKDSAVSKLNIFQQDGRMGVQKSEADYDLIIVDAFSGDGVPPHLLTREAMSIYFEKLAKRNGLLLIHTTSRYSRLFPLASATARSLGWSAISVYTEIKESTPNRDWDPTATEYIIVTPSHQIKKIESWFSSSEENDRIKQTLHIDQAKEYDEKQVWSDERHSAIQAIDIEKYLFD